MERLLVSLQISIVVVTLMLIVAIWLWIQAPHAQLSCRIRISVAEENATSRLIGEGLYVTIAGIVLACASLLLSLLAHRNQR